MVAVQASVEPLVIDDGPPPGASPVERDLLTHLGDGAVAVPVRWQGQLTGVMLVGPERTGSAYTLEDMEFFATVAEQMAGAVVTARLSETVAQAREFEAFHRLTSFVIHDLKNSITALSLLSQNALANFDDPEFQRDAIKTLSRTVGRMRALLTRLASRQEAASARVEVVDLSALALEATRPIDGGGRVSFTKDLGKVPLVPGDPEALLKVIQNLVTNAVEAIPGTGTVTVRTCTEPGWAVLSVTDTGCGMSKDFQQRDLFAPFRSTKSGGWGIGLYQARSIIEAHGGSIEVASEEGKGTAFRIKLRIAPLGSEVAL
jgi:putative PEP-CTERM system histidine kinase